MKCTKKLASMLLALAMVLSLTATAFAAQEGTLTDGSITISNAVSGETYSIYQILYLESYDPNAHAYAYRANEAWAEWLASQADYVTIDAQGYVTWVENADPAAFAAAAKEYAKTLGSNDGTMMAGTDPVKFENLKLGYYLVDTSLGTLCSLDTTNPSVTIVEKNEVPRIDKEVEEDSTGGYGDKNDADIGQTVNFKTTVHAKQGARNYVVHDKMSAGLTFGSVTSVKAGENPLTVNTDYQVVVPGDEEENPCTFHVVFKQAYLDTITENVNIVIEYTATLNEDAVIAGDGNLNETWMDYGDSQHTTHDTTTTYTWEMPIYKYTMENTNKKPLEGAEFILYKVAEDKEQYAVVADGKLTGWTGEREKATTLISDGEGKIKIEGLDADTYYLEETKAPAGYNKLAGRVTIVIGENNILTQDGESTASVSIENKSGTELPSTGGMGTTLLYIAGGALVLLAMIVLVMKKRMGNAK